MFNLRGNQRTSGELSRKEGGKIFGSGSRTPIAITLLVKKPKQSEQNAMIYYHDIGDYLNREEKLAIVKKYGSVGNPGMLWQKLSPNEHGDWLNQRNETFDTFFPIVPENKFDMKAQAIFNTYAIGVATNRDAWVYNFSKREAENNMRRMIEFYNRQQKDFAESKRKNPLLSLDSFVDVNHTNISWTVNLKKDAEKGIQHNFNKLEMRVGIYRPFCKQILYFDKPFIERPGLNPKLFPNSNLLNYGICLTGMGSNKDFSVFLVSTIPDIQLIMNGQVFPLHYHEEREKQNPTLFDAAGDSEYIRRDGVSDFILERAHKQYGKNVSKEDIFYYVYGFLHSPLYRETFAADLKKMLPRLPLVEQPKEFWRFSKAGRELAELHINYESVPPYADVKVTGADKGFFKVEKMRFPKKDQKDTIIYNSKITIENIPAKAYEYVVNGKSAIEWIMERYQISTHKESGITNDPNDWANEVGSQRYILDLLLSVITVSVKTVDIVNALPKVTFE